MVKCQMNNCNQEGHYWRIVIDAPNSTALNGMLCKDHYNRLLKAIREIYNFGVENPCLKCKRYENCLYTNASVETLLQLRIPCRKKNMLKKGRF